MTKQLIAEDEEDTRDKKYMIAILHETTIKYFIYTILLITYFKWYKKFMKNHIEIPRMKTMAHYLFI